MQERLVVPGLKLVGAHEETVWVLLDPIGNVSGREAIENRFGRLPAAELVLAGFGGSPAPSFQPRLNGRNHESPPARCVEKRASFSSTAKWATHRPNSKSLSRGLRSFRYCLTASSTVCFVRLFFNSKVKTGSPLMKSAMSSARWVSSRL